MLLRLYESDVTIDWIAHGILDSVVDAFFPVLKDIEREVMDIDRMIYIQEELDVDAAYQEQQASWSSSSITVKVASELDVSSEKASTHDLRKRSNNTSFHVANASEESMRAHFAPQRPSPRLLFRRARRYLVRLWSRLWHRKADARVNPRMMTLRRMAKTRKLVTLLGRLLAAKADVITQIRKRLLQSGEPSLGNGGTKGEELEVAIYMGDVQGKAPNH